MNAPRSHEPVLELPKGIKHYLGAAAALPEGSLTLEC